MTRAKDHSCSITPPLSVSTESRPRPSTGVVIRSLERDLAYSHDGSKATKAQKSFLREIAVRVGHHRWNKKPGLLRFSTPV
jgi:hypothetical protein